MPPQFFIHFNTKGKVCTSEAQGVMKPAKPQAKWCEITFRVHDQTGTYPEQRGWNSHYQSFALWNFRKCDFRLKCDNNIPISTRSCKKVLLRLMDCHLSLRPDPTHATETPYPLPMYLCLSHDTFCADTHRKIITKPQLTSIITFANESQLHIC